MTPEGDTVYVRPKRPVRKKRAELQNTETVTVTQPVRPERGARTALADRSDPELARGGGAAPYVSPTRSRRQAGEPADEGGEPPNDPAAISKWRLAQRSSGADPNVKCIAPLHVDGRTSFRIDAPIEGWCRALRDLADVATRGGRLPATIDIAEDLHGVVPTANVRRPPRGRGVNVIFEHHAQLRLFPHLGVVTLEARAESLWGNGVDRWMTIWFDRVSRWVQGRSCPSPLHARRLGWTTTRLELASDFTDLRFFLEDVPRFDRGHGKIRLVDSRGVKPDGQVETIYIGDRGKDRLALSTHNKTQVLMAKKRKPEKSVYTKTWQAHGWDGVSPIRRVEARAHGEALQLQAVDGSGLTLDMTDPAALLDMTLLGSFWLHATTTRTRLTAADGSATDPRWLAVQAAGGVDQQVRYAQVPRDKSRRLDLAERRALAEREARRKLGWALGLTGRTGPEDLLVLVGRLARHPDFDAAVRASASSIPDGPIVTYDDGEAEGDEHPPCAR